MIEPRRLPTVPHDDDDDEFPAAPRPTRPPSAGPVPPPSAGPTAVGPTATTFGKVGRTVVGELTQVDGPPRGLIRTALSAGVRYAAPPPAVQGNGCWFRWLPAFGAERQFELPLPDDVPTAAVSLRAWRLTAPAEARATAVDAVAQTLLTLTAELHAAGWRLGLLTPDTVFRTPAGELLLPDFGYTWHGAHGAPPWDDDLTKPTWLNRESEFGGLFPAPPACLQLTHPDDWRLHPPFAAKDGAGGRLADLTLLARLFEYLLTGAVGPVTRAGVLAEVEAGDVPTADDFRQRLRKSPLIPRTLPVADARARRSGGSRALWMTVGAAAVIAVAAGAYLAFGDRSNPDVAGNPDPVIPSPVGTVEPPPVIPTPVPTPPVVEPPRTLAAVRTLIDAAVAKPDDAAARAAARTEWYKEFVFAVKEGADKQDPTAFSVKMAEMGDLLAKLPKATDPTHEEEEKRWTDYCAQFR